MKNSVNVGKYGNGYVEFLNAKHSNSEMGSRVIWTTNLAAISRGNDKSSNPEKRYRALMKEAEGGNPSRPFEFMPVIMDVGNIDNYPELKDENIIRLLKYSYADEQNEKVYTNMRAVIESGLPLDKIPFNETIEEFAAFKIKAPMFVWNQIITHTQLSTESQSDRVAKQEDYWLPDDLIERLEREEHRNIVKEYTMDFIGDIFKPEEFTRWMITHAPQEKIQNFLRDLGYKREIYSRAPYFFKMKEFVITGWVNDDDAWPHFLRERNAYMNDGGPKNWTQPETQAFAYQIRLLIENFMSVSREDILNG